VCTGIYALADTGLLDGRRVTTHWRYAAEVQRRWPKLRVDADAIFEQTAAKGSKGRGAEQRRGRESMRNYW
jgi:transcriptional regulator GlxA family with amidase domain